MPTARRSTSKSSKRPTLTATRIGTYPAVRLAMVVMTALAMVSAGVILAALIVRAVPLKNASTSIPPARVSANGYVAGEVLVKFAANATQLDRTRAVQAALQGNVRVTTTSTVKKRVGLRVYSQVVETVRQQKVSMVSMTPVFSTSVSLTQATAVARQARGTVADVALNASALRQWYVVRFNPAGADMNQIISSLAKQGKVERAELNRKVTAAASRAVSSTSAASSIRLGTAQQLATPLAGDVNNDGVVDGKDLRMLVNYLTQTAGPKPTNMKAADLDGDGNVDIADLTRLISLVAPSYRVVPHDLTGDGKFTVDDLNYIVAYLYESGPAPSPLANADWDGDGNVDISDLTLMEDFLYGDWAAGTMTYGSGDVNRDGNVDELDVNALSDYLYFDGPAPLPLGVADIDLDGAVDITDLTWLINIVYGIASGDTGTVRAASLTPSATVSTDTSGTPTNPAAPTFFLGDANADAAVNAKDIAYLVQYLYFDGQAPSPLSRVDLDADSHVDISDLTLLIALVQGQMSQRLAAADLNGDGVVTMADTQVIADYIANEPVQIDLTKADVTDDGVVDISDLTVLIDYVFHHQTQPSCPDVRTVNSTLFLNGDINGDGTRTPADTLTLAKQVYANGAAPALAVRSDVNCDGTVDGLDVLTLNSLVTLEKTPGRTVTTLPGDTNGDGVVDSHDIPSTAVGTTDVNLDGRVDFRDTYDLVRLLKRNVATKVLPDLTGDGKVTVADAVQLMQAVTGNGTVSSAADVNGDGTVDIADGIAYAAGVQAKLPTGSILAGDVNADGSVDCADAKSLFSTIFRKGPAVAPAARGDANSDSRLNAVDALLLAQRTCGSGTGTTPKVPVLVALLDTGVVRTAEISATLAATKEVANSRDNDGNGYAADIVGWNTTGNNPNVTDCLGHGSDLAQMLAAQSGITTNAKVIPVKVLDCKGNGTVTTVAQGLVYAVIRGADIANLPLSGFGSSTLLADVVQYARASGTLVIAAAGNDKVPVSRVFPANVSGAISVNATTNDGKKLASYSNTGAAVSAPGASAGVRFEGTSVSATYLAGTAALALTKNPTLTLRELEVKLLPVTTTPKPNPKQPVLLDAVKAVTQ